MEEATRIEDDLTSQLKKKDEICQTRDLEITYLSKELEERAVQLRSLLDFERSVMIQEEEVRKIEECLRRLLKEKEEIFQEQELESASLKRELGKTVNNNMKLENSSSTLNKSIKSRRSPIDKTRIGYKREHSFVEEKFTSLETKIDERPQSVAPNLRKNNKGNSKKNDYV